MLDHERFQHALSLTSDYVAIADAEGRLEYLNAAMATIVGPAAADPSQLRLCNLYIRRSAHVLSEEALPAAAADGSWRGELVIRGHAGRELPVDQLVVAEPDGFVLISRPLGGEQRIANELGAAEWRFQRVVEQLPLVTYVTLLDTHVPATYLSPQFETLVGYTAEEATSGIDLYPKLLHPEDRARVLAEHDRVIATGDRLDLEYRFVTRDGRVVWIHDCGDIVSEVGQPRYLQGCLLDITARKAAEEERDRLLRELDALATTDPVTQALNHRGGVAALDRALEQAEAQGTPFGVLFVDLDRFKRLNDTHGHSAGDVVLGAFKRIAGSCLRGRDVVCRWGGEEFLVVLPGTDAAAAHAVAERIRAVLARHRFDLAGGVHVTCSIGVASFPADGGTRAELVQAADEAMYEAKARGGNQVVAASDRTGHSARTSGDARAQDAAVEALVALIDTRDHHTAEHSARVAELAASVARALGFAPPQVELLSIAGRLHDIGMVAVPDALLLDPSPLDEAGWQAMYAHPVVAAQVIEGMSSLESAGPIVRAHHERWDGTGYPDGLAGPAIPMAARILAVVDAFDAMTVARPHRPALSRRAALRELHRCAGTHFDPDVVDAAVRVLGGGAHLRSVA